MLWTQHGHSLDGASQALLYMEIWRELQSKLILSLMQEWHQISLLTKIGYITKIRKNNWKLYTNSSYIMPNPSKLKKIKFNQGLKLRVDTFKLQLKIWCHFVQPIKAHVIGQPLNECDELLLFNATYQSASTNTFSQLQWQTATGQSKAKYKLISMALVCKLFAI